MDYGIRNQKIGKYKTHHNNKYWHYGNRFRDQYYRFYTLLDTSNSEMIFAIRIGIVQYLKSWNLVTPILFYKVHFMYDACYYFDWQSIGP